MKNAGDCLLIYHKFSLKAQFQLYMKCSRTFTAQSKLVHSLLFKYIFSRGGEGGDTHTHTKGKPFKRHNKHALPNRLNSKEQHQSTYFVLILFLPQTLCITGRAFPFNFVMAYDILLKFYYVTLCQETSLKSQWLCQP